MKDTIFSNINMRFQLTIEKIGEPDLPIRYMVKLVDDEQDNDRQNWLWIIELIGDGVYQLTYEQLIVRELVAFGSLGECLNLIKTKSLEHVEKLTDPSSVI